MHLVPREAMLRAVGRTGWAATFGITTALLAADRRGRALISDVFHAGTHELRPLVDSSLR